MSKYICLDGIETINDLLDAPVIEIVRCKDCKYYLPKQDKKPWKCSRRYCNNGATKATKDNDFCSYGERKE